MASGSTCVAACSALGSTKPGEQLDGVRMGVGQVHEQGRLLDGEGVPFGLHEFVDGHADHPAALGKIDPGDLQRELRRAVALVGVV